MLVLVVAAGPVVVVAGDGGCARLPRSSSPPVDGGGGGGVAPLRRLPLPPPLRPPRTSSAAGRGWCRLPLRWRRSFQRLAAAAAVGFGGGGGGCGDLVDAAVAAGDLPRSIHPRKGQQRRPQVKSRSLAASAADAPYDAFVAAAAAVVMLMLLLMNAGGCDAAWTLPLHIARHLGRAAADGDGAGGSGDADCVLAIAAAAAAVVAGGCAGGGAGCGGADLSPPIGNARGGDGPPRLPRPQRLCRSKRLLLPPRPPPLLRPLEWQRHLRRAGSRSTGGQQ